MSDQYIAEFEALAEELGARPPHPLRVECGAETWAALCEAYKASGPPPGLSSGEPPGWPAWAPSASHLPIVLVDDVPAWTLRVHMSDGSVRLERLERLR